jgi:hypothetical protein
METQQLRTPMDPLASLASGLFSAFSPLLSWSAQQKGSTFLLLPIPVAAARALTVLRRLFLLATQAFVSLFFTFLSAFAPAPAPPPQPQPPALAPTLPRVEPGSPAGDTCVGRALAHVLSVASRLPVASRKYELVRGLAERLLDDNVRAGGARVGAVNRAALAGAFARSLRQLESAEGGEWPRMELAARAVRTGMRWWWRPAAASSLDEGFGGPAAEKLAAELLWLGQKMAECGAAREAVVQFGDAARLGSRALVAEPALQVSLLRLAGTWKSLRFFYIHPPSQNICTFWLLQIIFDHSSYSKYLRKYKNNYDIFKIYTMIYLSKINNIFTIFRIKRIVKSET